jgi:hypothetical protein
MKNRKREICTSGSEGRGGGSALARGIHPTAVAMVVCFGALAHSV